MWNYTEKVMDHFLHPRNVGEIADADAVGEVGNIVCGDALKLFLKLDEAGERIIDVKFQTFGCASAIASSSALTELVKGRTIEEAAAVTNQQIADFLGELPEEKMHCSVMGMEALQAAISRLRGESDGRTTVGGESDDDAYDPEGLDRTVCFCFSVTERKIREVAKANGLKDVAQVMHFCKAGGGCGGCQEDIKGILESFWGEQGDEAGEGAEGVVPAAPMTNLQKIMRVQQVINDDIRPALQGDGGDLELVDVEGDTVMVKLTGACASCPSAHVTLERWVEARLHELVSPDLVVQEAGG